MLAAVQLSVGFEQLQGSEGINALADLFQAGMLSGDKFSSIESIHSGLGLIGSQMFVPRRKPLGNSTARL
jgi:hypothetical protein